MDITPIVARLSIIAKNVQLLKEHRSTSHDEFINDQILQDAVEREFQVTIQAALDIGSMILSDQSVSVPETYGDIFPKLSEIGVIPVELAEKLAGMAKFRNILVHMYVEVDIDKVYQYLQHNLGDMEAFARYIGEYVGKEL